MDARIVDLQTLFGKPVSYRIPQFQRPYAWKRDDQWIPLWDDARNVAEHWLSLNDGEQMRPHFMGAIVLQRQGNNSAEVEKRLVVDGQQRLTTLQLLIRATQEAFASIDDADRAARLQRLTSNDKSYWGGTSDNETKIRQSNVNDQRAFQGAIRNGEKEEGRYNSGIRGAYAYFSAAVDEWLNAEPDKRVNRMTALEETLTKYMQTAAIDLDEDEQPHIIFETLNARGEPLKQSDLIKNTVMYEAQVVDDANKAEQLWGMFANDWWANPTREGRLSRTHIDRFLNYWMVVLTRKDVTAERVAAAFREFINPKNLDNKQPIDQIASDIRRAGGIYQDMEETRHPGIQLFLRRMKAMEIGVIMPLLLWLYTAETPGKRRTRCVEALESYLVRRMLCGLNSNGLNRLFLEIMEKIEPSDADGILIGYLNGQTLENRVWPNDRMIIEDLAGRPMRGTVARQKMVMDAIEMRLRSDMTEPPGDTSKLTVEHIMPQKWETNWPIPASLTDRAQAEEDRREAVKAIGNLTLTSGKLNTRLSNGTWDEKRGALDQHSSLFINKNLLAHAPAVWDENAIWERSRNLAKLVAEVWPSGDKF